MQKNESTLTAEQLASIFKVLAIPACLRIIRELKKQPRYVTELAGELNLAQGSVGNYLAELLKAGIVQQLPRRSNDTSWRCQLYALREPAARAVTRMERAATSLIA